MLITNVLWSRRVQDGYRVTHSAPAGFLWRDARNIFWLDNSSLCGNVLCIAGYFISLVLAH